MLISVRHITRYSYAEPVTYSIQTLRLTPQSFAAHRLITWNLRVTACESPLQFEDGFGNTVHLAAISGSHREVAIEAEGRVETEDCNGILVGITNTIPQRVYLRETSQTRADAAIRELARSVSGEEHQLTQLHQLVGLVRDRVEYVPGITNAHTGAAEALADGKGVCQDHAHVFISAARCLGIPARYVTGYLVLDEGTHADAHHAWAEAWLDGLGWVGFDVTNRVCPTERYVRLAAGLDAGYAAPITGSRRGGAVEALKVSVEVQHQSAQQ